MRRNLLLYALVVVGLLVNSIKAQENNQGTKAEAKKIYLLAAISVSQGDDKDPGAMAAFRAEKKMVISAFKSHVPKEQLVVYGDKDGYGQAWPDETGAASSELGYNVDDLREGLASCPAGPKDAIVVYWSGHGGINEGQEHVLRTRGNVDFERRQLMAWISRHQCRLSVLITDTCAVPTGAPSPIALPTAAPPSKIARLFDVLFLEPSGTANISSAAAGELASYQKSSGGVFTRALAGAVPPDRPESEFVGFLYSHAEDGSISDWNDFIDGLQQNQSALFRLEHPDGVFIKETGERQYDQHIWVLELPGDSGGYMRRCRHHCRLLQLIRNRRRR